MSSAAWRSARVSVSLLALQRRFTILPQMQSGHRASFCVNVNKWCAYVTLLPAWITRLALIWAMRCYSSQSTRLTLQGSVSYLHSPLVQAADGRPANDLHLNLSYAMLQQPVNTTHTAGLCIISSQSISASRRWQTRQWPSLESSLGFCAVHGHCLENRGTRQHTAAD